MGGDHTQPLGSTNEALAPQATARGSARGPRRALHAAGRLIQVDAELLKEGFERSTHWAHTITALFVFVGDFLKPLIPHCLIAILVGSFCVLALFLLPARLIRTSDGTRAAVLAFCTTTVVLSLLMVGLQRLSGDDPDGAAAHFVPGLKEIQQRLGVIETTVVAIKSDTGKIKSDTSNLLEGQKRLERLVVDAAGGGAASVQAIADIRGLLRPGNPDIDAVPAEKLPALVQKILDDLKKPGVNPSDFGGAVRQALADAQRKTGQLDFAGAAHDLDAVLARAEAEANERALGTAALLGERGHVARLQLRYREAAGFYAKAAELAAVRPETAASYRRDEAGSLYDQGGQFGDNDALTEAIGLYQSLLGDANREKAPLDWATAQNNLGIALWRLGERESGTAQLDAAVVAYRAALLERTRERVPLDWAETQNDLGAALERLGERENGTAQLDAAVVAYRAALLEWTRERVPLDWAATQNNLGAALERLGERESGTAQLDAAVAAYRAALLEGTRERVPLEWAMTQNNLGNALEALGERESGTAQLEAAVAAYRSALLERTRERVPLEWAMTQNNLGNALETLGERESGTAHLDAAVVAYRAALLERTRERVPLDWAETQNDLGAALEALGERESGTAQLDAAVAAYRAALLERTRERVPLDWAAAQNNLGNALETLGERESGTAQLDAAIAAYRAALLEWTRERVPLDWAATQNNLGNALEKLGERESGTAQLDAAVAAYRAALLERTRERVPLDWAYSQHGLANALAVLAERTGSAALLREAIADMSLAVDGYQEVGDTYWLPIAQSQLAELNAALGKLR